MTVRARRPRLAEQYLEVRISAAGVRVVMAEEIVVDCKSVDRSIAADAAAQAVRELVLAAMATEREAHDE